MKFWLKTLDRIIASGRLYLRRHWQLALRWRERLRLSEETLHLMLAVMVGSIGGLCNLAFYLSNESLKLLAFQQPGDPADIAPALTDWQRLLIPTLGGLAAGLVLWWGLRFAGKQ